MKTLPLGPFLGVNNRLPDSALHVDKQGDFVRDAVNVDLGNTGHFHRRQGYTLVQALTGPHSVYESGSRRYLVRSGVLYQVTLAPYGETLVKLLTTNDPVRYLEFNGEIYFSNGTDCGRIAADGTVYPWAMVSPGQPTVTAISGSLPAGKYQVGITYVNNVTGEESGCAGTANHELAAAGALRVALPGSSAGATHINVYASLTNGSVPGLYATVPIGTTSLDITTLVTTRTLLTAYQEPMPGCTRLFIHNGRLCGITPSGLLIYGEPYRFGYWRPTNYVPLEATATIALSAQNGVYVAANKTFWIPGDINAPEDKIADVLPYGAVPGTEFNFPHNSKVGWFGEKGFVVADLLGQVEAVMTESVELTAPASGNTIVLEDRGIRRAVSCGWCLNLETCRVTAYSNYSFTSAYGGYATKADGLYQLGGDTDSGVLIQGSVELGRLNFGTEQLKFMPAVYFGGSSDAAMAMTVSVPGEDSYTYEAESGGEDLRMQRIDPGLGLEATWFDVTLENQEGADFIMARISFLPAASNRRI